MYTELTDTNDDNIYTSFISRGILLPTILSRPSKVPTENVWDNDWDAISFSNQECQST